MVIASILPLICSSGASGVADLLLAPGFKLEARLKVIRRDSPEGLDENLVVKEFYSNKARRARLDLVDHDYQEDAHLYKRNVNYYYHDYKQQMIKTSFLEGFPTAACAATNSKELVEDLFGALARQDKQLEAKDWLQVTDSVPSYVIGLARLLLLVEFNEKKMNLVFQGDPVVRNQHSVKYKLNLSGGRDLAIYYSKLNHHNYQPIDLPLRIWMGLEGGGEIIVDYSSIEMFNLEQDLLSWPAESEAIDMLSFPLGIDCSKHLTQANILNGLTAPKVVSFKAEIKRRSFISDDYLIKNSFVAYDGFLRMLRLDTLRMEPNTDRLDEYSISIYEITRHRRYNVKQQISAGSKSDLTRGKISIDSSVGFQCTASKLYAEGTLNPFEPILPLHSLTEMGDAVVRGIKARVFEQVSSTLPPMLFSKVNYLAADGKLMSQYEPDENMSANTSNKKSKDDYIVTYYFAELETSLLSVSDTLGNDGGVGGEDDHFLQMGPLIRIDISQTIPLYRIEIRDFIWQLAEAPNGDKQDELFSLYDRCSTISGGDETKSLNSHVKLSMDLEYELADQSTSSSYTAFEVSEKLENSILRNKALIRALCDASEQILAKQLYDIESKMILNDDKLTIKSSAKLSGQSLILYEAISFGTSLPTVVTTIQTTGASDFDDCYWDAVHRRKSGQQLLFSYCNLLCIIDENPKLDYSSNKKGSIKSSLVFNPLNTDTKSYPCLVLKLEPQLDELNAKIPGRSIYNKLRATTIQLPLIDSFGGSKKLERLSFKVKQINLSNDDWTINFNKNSKNQSENRDYLLKGLALWPDEARLIKPPLAWIEQQNDNRQQQIVPFPMSYDVCHSSCMANISCNSFSFCSNGKHLECLVSDLKFRDASIFDQISSKLSKLTRAERNKGNLLIDLPVVQANEDGEQQTTIQTKQLKLNNKCQIYNKYAIEMFHSTEMITIKPPEKYLIAVDDEEQCAASCLRANVKFFKRMAKARSRMLYKSMDSANDTTTFDDLLERQSINMKYWCGSFKYLNLVTAYEPYYLNSFIAPEKLTKNGLCLMSRVQTTDRKPSDDAMGKAGHSNQGEQKTKMPKLVFHSYEFAYTKLYEKQHGIRLKAESRLQESTNDLDQLRNNQLISTISDEEHCARACFLQTTLLKPFCKSFELVRYNNQSSSYCIFNSITLSEAFQRVKEIQGATGERQEVPISTESGDNVEIWHFEPRSAYTLDHLVLAQTISNSFEYLPVKGGPVASVSHFGLLMVVALAIIGGLLIGLNIGNRLSRHVSASGRRESIENPSRSFLNSLITSDSSSTVSHRRFESDVDLPELTHNAGF